MIIIYNRISVEINFFLVKLPDICRWVFRLSWENWLVVRCNNNNRGEKKFCQRVGISYPEKR